MKNFAQTNKNVDFLDNLFWLNIFDLKMNNHITTK